MMDLDKKYYLVYRIYSPKERMYTKEHDVVIYGWSDNKKILKLFLDQRDKNKYRYLKLTYEEIGKRYSDNYLRADQEITYLEIFSNQLQDNVILFMTMAEMKNAEVKIQTMFRDASRLSNIKSKEDLSVFVEMVTHLETKYQWALDYLGYRPPEILARYDSPSEDDNIEDRIELAYDEPASINEPYYNKPGTTVPGLAVIGDDVSKKILYSLESFVKVLVEDF